MPTRRPAQALLLTAAWAFCAAAPASYGQMRLDGVMLLLAFGLLIAWSLLVDVALATRLFRFRLAVVAGTSIAVAVAYLFFAALGSSVERAGYFKGTPGGAALVVLAVTSAVLLPFIVVAPFAQYVSMRGGRRWPGWITAWMGVQAALLPGFFVLSFVEDHVHARDYAAGQAEGRAVTAGGVPALLEAAAQRHERIWGTGISAPWPQTGTRIRATAHRLGLAAGLEASALVAAREPLGEADRAALHALATGRLGPLGVPRIRAKLMWDALASGAFARQLAPHGIDEASAVDEVVLPLLLERLEQQADARVCPGGRMHDDDRAVLGALVAKQGPVWNPETRADEMRPAWADFPQRIDRLCRAPEAPGEG